MSENQNNNSSSDEALEDFFGTAKNGTSDMNWTVHSIKDDSPNVFRIAPPVKSLKAVGKWKVYDRLHYGYVVPNEQNPDKPRARPFRCIEQVNRTTKMIEQDCPECAFLAAEEEKVAKMVKSYMEKGKSEQEAEEFVKGARKLLREHNLDKKWYVLAKNLAGEWGLLKLGYRAMTALEDTRNEYIKANGGADPLDATAGVWFEFTRQGKNRDTRYAVKLAMESLGGGRFQVKSGALTRVDAEALKRCPDLAKVNDNKVLSYDQIQALVSSGGDPTVAATVFGASRRERSPAPVQVQTTQRMPEAQSTAVLPPSSSEAEEIAKLRAQLAALEKQAPQKSAPPPAAVQPSKPTASAPVNDLMKLDAESFLAMFDSKK
jgi:hypothetical protein